jgi:hypothetical protein
MTPEQYDSAQRRIKATLLFHVEIILMTLCIIAALSFCGCTDQEPSLNEVIPFASCWLVPSSGDQCCVWEQDKDSDGVADCAIEACQELVAGSLESVWRITHVRGCPR